MVDITVEHLARRGYAAAGLHGDMKQRGRDRVMENFRAGHTQILVATDVAARGIDVEDIEAVFNFDIPLDEESYVHRIGRTGRAGREGSAYTLVSSREMYHLKRIQRFIRHTISLAQLPTATDVQERKLTAILERVKQVIDAGHLSVYANAIQHLLNENTTTLDVAAALLKMVSKKAHAAVAVEETSYKYESPAYEPREERPRRERFSGRGGRGGSRDGGGQRRPRRREGSRPFSAA
jgi:ATP-dependent RNA helicase DeaD